MGTSLTQGDHEGRVEQTQICPVRVIHYSPGKETLAGQAQSEDTQKQLNRINKSDKFQADGIVPGQRQQHVLLSHILHILQQWSVGVVHNQATVLKT